MAKNKLFREEKRNTRWTNAWQWGVSLSHAILLLFIQSFFLCGFLATFDYALEADASNRQNSHSPHLNGKPTSLPVTYTRKFLVDSIFFNGDFLPSFSTFFIFYHLYLLPRSFFFFQVFLNLSYDIFSPFSILSLEKSFILSYYLITVSWFRNTMLPFIFFLHFFFSSIGWNHIYSLCIFSIKFNAKTFAFEISKWSNGVKS